MDLNQIKPKPRPDDVPVGNVKRESGAVTESIRPKTIEKRPRDLAKEFGDLEFRWSLDKELIKNPIARLGFENTTGTDKVTDFNNVEGYVDYIMSTPTLKTKVSDDLQIFNDKELKDELLYYYSKGLTAVPELFDNAFYIYSRNTPSQAKLLGDMAVPKNKSDEALPDDIFVDTDVGSPRVWAHEMTHRGFDRLIEYKNQIGAEEFRRKYGRRALETLEQIAKDPDKDEFYTEYFDFVDDAWNYPNLENMGRDNKEKFLDQNSLKNIENFQRQGSGVLGKKNPQFGGVGYLIQAAEDILKEVEPPRATPYGHLSFMGRLRKKLGFAEGGLTQDDQMEKLDLARSYGVTVVDPEETSETVKALGKAALESIPGISTATTIRDIKEELQEEDPSLAKIGMLAASEAVGMIPGLGQVGKTIIRKTSTKLVDKAADAKEAERLIKDSEALEQWRKENKLPESQRQKNPEGSKKAASDLLEGEITSKEARQRIKDFIPDPQEFTAEQVLDMMPSLTQITGALGKKAKKYPIIGVKGKDLDKGQVVSSRLDIPAYDDYDTWVVSIHDGNQKSGSVVGYGQAIRLKNINFGSDPKTALDIARGKRLVQATGEDAPKPQGKATIARIFGEYQPEDPYDLQRQAAEIIASGSEEWTQIGMNPYRGSAFYNKKTGAPVFEADEVIQVGPLVLAKNVKKPTISQMKQMAVRTRDGKLRMFNEGGTAMKDQMQMVFKDDGMTKDPVSGNDIPPGSLAKEVRDDIPAMLSEGEYVVPADVLRYYGVNFFENLRNQAKSGLQTMENTGRIGGDPMSPQQVQQNMSGQPMTNAPPAQPVAANTGPAMLGQQSQTGTNTATTGQPVQNTFTPMNFSTVGFSQYQQPTQKPVSVTSTKTYVNATNTSDIKIVTYVNGVVTPPTDVKFTQPPYYLQGSPALAEAIEGAPKGGGGGGGGGTPDPEPKDPNAWAKNITNPEEWAEENLQGKANNLINTIKLGTSVARVNAMAELAKAQGNMDLYNTLSNKAKDFVSKNPVLNSLPNAWIDGDKIAADLQKDKDLVNNIFSIDKEIVPSKDPETSAVSAPKPAPDFSSATDASSAAGLAYSNASEGVDPIAASQAAAAGVNAGVSPAAAAEAAAAGATSIGSGEASTIEETGQESIGPSGSGSGAFNKGGLMQRKKRKAKK
tara:strand:- start:357 stop:3866 length:3510 start_codon:yes stop_codon:yes gene_type:complete